jgi:hypothetical protein
MAKALFAVALWFALASSAHAVAPEKKAPSWLQLSSEQQQVLAPLSTEWDKLDDFGRKKWLGIAKRFPAMKPDEQQRVQARMREWAMLTPQQRRLARENFKNIEKLPPEKKQTVRENWDEYQRLPDEEKRRLAKSRAKPPKPPDTPSRSIPPAPPAEGAAATKPAGK